MSPHAALTSLRHLSARIGRDPLLTQANSGNTSIKLGRVLWVKASGKWLSDALQEDIFARVDLASARESIRRGHNPAAAAMDADGEKLTPSVETAMHAVLPHCVVVHVHSVNAIAHAVRWDARPHLEQLLAGLQWEWIPYAASGLPLAAQIEQALRRSPLTDVFVLGNHGLIVCGDDCETAELLLAEVEARLSTNPRRAPEFDEQFLRRLAAGSAWRLPAHTRLHALATDANSRDILSKGILYPSQTVFLGNRNPWASFYSGLYSEAALNFDPAGTARRFVVVRDKGVLVSDTLTSEELETLLGLVEVVQRIDSSVPLRYLTAAEADHTSTHGLYRETPALHASTRFAPTAGINAASTWQTELEPACPGRPVSS